MREVRVLDLLFHGKNIKINPDITLEVITQLSLLPIEYNCNIKDLKKYSNLINCYFKDTKLKYFQDDNYN